MLSQEGQVMVNVRESWSHISEAGKQKTRDVHAQPMLTVKMGLSTPANSPNLGTPSEACLPS